MKKGLGKGLGALLTIEDESGIKEMKLNEIEPNNDQPRKDFDEQKLSVLAESIEQHGIVQPIIVKKDEGYYKIVAGERRWRAAKIAGVEKIPVIVRDLDEKQVMEFALIENLQREDLNAIEEAEAYLKLIEEYNITQDELSKIVGKSRSAIANSLRLNKLDYKIKKLVREDVITEGHARAILGVEQNNTRFKIVEKIVDNDLSVRETEKLVRKLSADSKNRAKPEINKDLEIECKSVENSLKNILGTKVSLQANKKKGKIVIEYYSNDELDRIINLIKKIKIS